MDYAWYAAPAQFQWRTGETHTVEATDTDPQGPSRLAAVLLAVFAADERLAQDSRANVAERLGRKPTRDAADERRVGSLTEPRWAQRCTLSRSR